MYLQTLIVLFLMICTFFGGPMAKVTQVKTPVGEIIGKISQTTVDRQRRFVGEFLGIPYAKSPVGDLRFRKPEIKEPFRLPFNGTKPGSICPQAGLNILPIDKFTISEDCLNLNIYTPYPMNKGTSLAVLVYIHGGAFVTGAANFYIGDVLSAFGEVVVVTLNYRLSIFGFLSTKDSTALGNFGLWDQHYALKWIHKNIASFGGNPECVTLVGQSVGSISAIYQALYLGNKGLIHRVIAESGTAINFGTLYAGPMLHDVNFKTLGHMIGCSSITSSDLVACLRRKDEETILASLHMSFYQIPFGPVYDGDFIKDDPRILLDKSMDKFRDIREFFGSLDLLIGSNSMEGAIYLSFMWKALLMVSDMETFNITDKQFREKVIPSVMQQIYGTSEPEIARDAIYIRYSDITSYSDNAKLRSMLLKLTTDYMFKVPTLKTAMLHSEVNAMSNTFVYEFLTKPTLTFKQHATPSWVTEANHGDEAEFVFGFSRQMLDALMVADDFHPTVDEIRLSYTMMKLWTNFAKTGFPNNPEMVPGCPTWKTFDSSSKSYLELSTDLAESSMKNGYAEASGSFWLTFLPKIAPTIAYEMNNGQQQTGWAYADSCETKLAGKGVDETQITIIVLSVVAGMLGIGFIMAVYCGLNVRKRASTTYDAVEM